MFSQERKARAQLERLLREFPWLWGIKRDWCFGDHVSVQSISFETLCRSIFSEDQEAWWVKLSSDGSEHPLGHLRKLNLVSAVGSLSNRAIQTIEQIGNNRVEFLIQDRFSIGKLNHRSSWITIYRAPRGQNLHQMCCEVSGICV